MDFRAIADAVAHDIATGRLTAGDRLPPQREFARRRGIAGSTAARVYAELVRRGLTVGEVGRGTYVRATPPTVEPALAEPRTFAELGTARVDLELNFPVVPGQAELLARSMQKLLRGGLLEDALRPVGAAGTPAARQAAAVALARTGWAPDPRQLLFAGNGRQAIAGAHRGVGAAGERLGVEAFTYPVVKGVAARLGVTLVPLAMDDDGVVPAALAQAPVRAVYLQPTLHNPLGVTMSQRRREDIAKVLEDKEIYAIEDSIYGFLRKDSTPIAALAPQWTVVVDSLSKRLAPGLTVGFCIPPATLVDRIGTALRSGGWTAAHFALAATTHWMADGTLATVEESKRTEAKRRQEIVATTLADFTVRADPRAYHCWWELPEPWRADTFVAAAARRGIAVSPGAIFAVGVGQAPHAVRLALAAPPVADLAAALESLAALARDTPDGGVE
ncbi:aminotransferase-like domain-containing protein [Fodinicola feengrottensis]|uniref:aminotransferase-like domain-containing protein n=1 Tax=Fodinicola feengrottensis TaxID=435914 RepID=UPI0013D4DB87|nr:PLP-dependent aminotransferase family protein [Fodinicola feengrottensis]